MNDDDRTLREMLESDQSQPEASEVVPGVWLSPGLGNSYMFATPDGNLLVNTGTFADAERTRPLFARAAPGPLRYVVATQSYVAQMGGLEAYLDAGAKLIAQRAFVANRQDQLRLDPYYASRNRKIYGAVMDKAGKVAGREFTPDLVVDDKLALELGGRRFEMLSTPGGETTDSIVVWLPDEGVLATGNLFGPVFGNHPNLNTVRGDKPRSARLYLESVRRVRELGARTILSAHQKIEGADHISDMLGRMIAAVESVLEQTIAGMNAGLSLRQLMRKVAVSPELGVGEAHGKVTWNVRAIWHEYSGWFDYDEGTAGLYAVPASAVASDLVGLAGPEPIVSAARRHLEAGQPVEALHLLAILDAAGVSEATARAIRRGVLDQLMERSGGANFSEAAWLRAELNDVKPD